MPYRLPFQVLLASASYTDKKENPIFLICKEIQNGAVAKSYMTNGLLIYMVKYLRISSYIRKPFLIYDFATVCSTLNFLIFEENFIFFFISVLSAPATGIYVAIALQYS